MADLPQISRPSSSKSVGFSDVLSRTSSTSSPSGKHRGTTPNLLHGSPALSFRSSASRSDIEFRDVASVRSEMSSRDRLSQTHPVRATMGTHYHDDVSGIPQLNFNSLTTGPPNAQVSRLKAIKADKEHKHHKKRRLKVPVPSAGSNVFGSMYDIKYDEAVMNGSLSELNAGELTTMKVIIYQPSARNNQGSGIDRSMLEEFINSHGGFAAIMKGPEQTPIQITELEVGTWVLGFSARAAGKYQLAVLLGHKHLPHSPFECVVFPSPTCAYNCFARGTGLFVAKSGEHADFEIVSRDSCGNDRTTGNDQFVVQIDGPQEHMPVEFVDRQDGTYACRYWPLASGRYSISIFLDKNEVGGSPFGVDVLPCDPCASECLMSGEALHGGAVGKDTMLRITARDRFGNRVNKGGHNFDVSVIGPVNQTQGKVAKSDHLDGTYLFTWYWPWFGGFHLHATLDGEHINGSPHWVSIDSGRTDPQTSETSLLNRPGKRLMGVAGRPSTFGIQARDRFGNCQHTGGDPFMVKIRGPAVIEPEIVDGRDGTYAVSFKAELEGNYFISVKLNGYDLPGSAFLITITNAEEDAETCVVTGAGLSRAQAGFEASFEIMAYDTYKNRVPTGGADFTAKLTPLIGDLAEEGTPVAVTFLDDERGTYFGSYTPTLRGRHRLHLYLRGVPLGSSPWDIVVVPGPPCITETIAHGDGLSSGTAGETVTFWVEVRDEFGNYVTEGGCEIEAVITHTVVEYEVEGEVEDNEDGTYTVKFTAEVMGEYLIAVRLFGGHICDSPFAMTLEPGAAKAANCSAEGTGVDGYMTVEGYQGVHAGSENSFLIHSRDRFHNEISVGGAEFYIEMNMVTMFNDAMHNGLPNEKIKGMAGYRPGNDDDDDDAASDDDAAHTESNAMELSLVTKVHVMVTDNQDGSYECTYAVFIRGLYRIAVFLDGEEISGSPFEILVQPADPDPKSCFISGSMHKALQAGVKDWLFVQVKDEFDNRTQLAKDEDVVLRVKGPEGTSTTPFEAGQDGLYHAPFVGYVTGQYECSVLLLGEHVYGSPFNVTMTPGPTRAERSMSEGPGLSAGMAGVWQSFTVIARDIFNNERGVGGDDFKVQVLGPSSPHVTIVDNKSGTYSISYCVTAGGDYSIYITLHGYETLGSPFLAVISPAETDVTSCIVEGEGLQHSKTGMTAEFKLQSLDSYGNKQWKGGDPWQVSIEGPVSVPVILEDYQNGKYSARYTCQRPGVYDIFITLRGADIPNSPFAMICERFVKPGSQAVPDPAGTSGRPEDEMLGGAVLNAMVVQTIDLAANEGPRGFTANPSDGKASKVDQLVSAKSSLAAPSPAARKWGGLLALTKTGMMKASEENQLSAELSDLEGVSYSKVAAIAVASDDEIHEEVKSSGLMAKLRRGMRNAIAVGAIRQKQERKPSDVGPETEGLEVGMSELSVGAAGADAVSASAALRRIQTGATTPLLPVLEDEVEATRLREPALLASESIDDVETRDHAGLSVRSRMSSAFGSMIRPSLFAGKASGPLLSSTAEDEDNAEEDEQEEGGGGDANRLTESEEQLKNAAVLRKHLTLTLASSKKMQAVDSQ